MFRSRLAIAGLLIAALAAACSSPGASPTEEASAEAPAEETASAAPETAEATPEATADAGSGNELADVLPTEVGGLTIDYEFAEGEQAFGAEGMPPEAVAFLERVGGDPSDISSAFGLGLDMESGTGISIVAFRIAGADESALRDEFRAVIEEDGTQVVAETTMSGKDVLSFGPPESEPAGFLYVKGDTVFMVGGSPPELVEELVGQLP